MKDAGKKIVFGFIGPIASGKGTVCRYLINKHGAGYVRFSSILRDIANRLHIQESRENLQNLSGVLRQNFGDDLLAFAVAKDVLADTHAVVAIDGVRREPDIKELIKLPNFYLVSVDADIRTRFERITKRSENVDDQSKTFEQFEKDNVAEAEQQIAALQEKAKFTLDNNGSLEDLYKQVDELVGRVQTSK